MLLFAALSLGAIGCSDEVPTEPTGTTAPRITSVTPATPVASAAAQTLVVHGERFSAGISLNLVIPSGATVTIPPSAITELETTSFRTTVVLAASGAYALTVRDTAGQVSPSFSLAVQSNPNETTPVIAAISPGSVTATPLQQTVTVHGANFVAGLAVSVVDPDGLVSLQSANSIGNLSATRFDLVMVFGKTGAYSLRVINPSGQASNTVNVVAGL